MEFVSDRRAEMKIQIVKKGSNKVKTMNVCPWIVDVGTDSTKK